MSTEASTAADLAEIEAELATFTIEERTRNARIHRARLIEQAVGAVRDAEENAKRLTLKIAGFDAAIAIVTKIGKLTDTLEDGVPGSRSVLHDGYGRPGRQEIGCLASFLEDVGENSLAVLKANRQTAEESLRATEQRLADIKAEVSRLSRLK